LHQFKPSIAQTNKQCRLSPVIFGGKHQAIVTRKDQETKEPEIERKFLAASRNET
jgi:hypothetical protein